LVGDVPEKDLTSLKLQKSVQFPGARRQKITYPTPKHPTPVENISARIDNAAKSWNHSTMPSSDLKPLKNFHISREKPHSKRIVGSYFRFLKNSKASKLYLARAGMNTYNHQRKDPAAIQYIPHVPRSSGIFDVHHDQSHEIIEGLEFYRLEWETLDEFGVLTQQHEFIQAFEAHLHVGYDEIESWENQNASIMSEQRWRDRDRKYQYGETTKMEVVKQGQLG
jgi:hypothetical protein